MARSYVSKRLRKQVLQARREGLPSWVARKGYTISERLARRFSSDRPLRVVTACSRSSAAP